MISRAYMRSILRAETEKIVKKLLDQMLIEKGFTKEFFEKIASENLGDAMCKPSHDDHRTPGTDSIT